MININVKRDTDKAHLPKFLTKNSVSASLVAVEIIKNGLFNVVYDCKIVVDIPEGYVGLILHKQFATNKSLVMTNPVSVVYTDRSSIQVSFNRTFWGFFTRKKYQINTVIAELLILKLAEVKYKDVRSLTGRVKPKLKTDVT